MTSKRKIIIDKCILQGSSLPRLIDLAQKNLIILPHILFEECLTTKRKPGPEILLEKAEQLIKKGAYISYSRRKIIEIEKSTLLPLNSIIDEEGTKIIRNNNIQFTQRGIQSESEKSRSSFKPMIDIVKKLSIDFWNNLSKKPYVVNWRQPSEDDDRITRLSKICFVVEQDLKSWIPIFSTTIHSHITTEWTTWHIYKALLTYGIDWAYKRNKSGPSYEESDITNDVYDLVYLFSLSKVDVLMTRDRKLLAAIAQAMYPKKTVISEIPDGGWTG